ncbi:MAG: DUF3750 domain-containing protein [Gammaproteobacteria bacterium]|nr:MAG: DUF3750 domain-containing protein [Gammaproteobacteria bacterium]UTW42410.1 DUF3750 domain-containing protein [bacterium SCSIO 12844]
MNLILISFLILILFLLGPLYLLLSGKVKIGLDWRTASHAPCHFLKKYPTENEAVIVLFSAKSFNWRGAFSTHCWLATKLALDNDYTIYQVIGWNQYKNKPIVDISTGNPDKLWYNALPKIEAITIGNHNKSLIEKLKNIVNDYPYANTYHAWPGPNSNTFINYLIKELPQLNFTTPYNALGRDYYLKLKLNHLSILGLIGYRISFKSFYLTLLGLTLGISFKPLGFIIPGIGLVAIFKR